MNKKGFTLIELLAVIVILAIIALIAAPKVLNIIENSRKQAVIESTRGIARTAKNFYAKQVMENVKEIKVPLVVEGGCGKTFFDAK